MMNFALVDLPLAVPERDEINLEREGPPSGSRPQLRSLHGAQENGVSRVTESTAVVFPLWLIAAKTTRIISVRPDVPRERLPDRLHERFALKDTLQCGLSI